VRRRGTAADWGLLCSGAAGRGGAAKRRGDADAAAAERVDVETNASATCPVCERLPGLKLERSAHPRVSSRRCLRRDAKPPLFPDAPHKAPLVSRIRAGLHVDDGSAHGGTRTIAERPARRPSISGNGRGFVRAVGNLAGLCVAVGAAARRSPRTVLSAFRRPMNHGPANRRAADERTPAFPPVRARGGTFATGRGGLSCNTHGDSSHHVLWSHETAAAMRGRSALRAVARRERGTLSASCRRAKGARACPPRAQPPGGRRRRR
jgi:hypothetical protein